MIGEIQMRPTYHSDSLRTSAAKHLWMHNRDWSTMPNQNNPIIVVDGNGVKVTDSDGISWIDVNGGYNSVNVGYGRTEISQAADAQMSQLAYFPQGTTTIPTIQLAEKIAEITPGSLNRVFPVSGGSEANETALKIARAYHKRRGEHGRYKIISRKGSYHGGTGGVYWLGGVPLQNRQDYEPAYPGMLYAPQPNPYRCELGGKSSAECATLCSQAVEDLIIFHGPESIAAFIAEPISQPQGAVIPGDEYWPAIREICDKYGILLIDDEVICGFGRTGKMFGIQHWDVIPDIMTVGKGIISSYLPLGATIVRDEIANYFMGEDKFFRHVFTFSGHPVPSAAALKNIEILENENLVIRSAETGAYFKTRLEELMEIHPIIGDVRGIGMLLALELVADRKTKNKFSPNLKIPVRLNEKFQNHNLLLRISSDIITLGPPLCVSKDEVNEIIEALNSSLAELEKELGLLRT